MSTDYVEATEAELEIDMRPWLAAHGDETRLIVQRSTAYCPGLVNGLTPPLPGGLQSPE